MTDGDRPLDNDWVSGVGGPTRQNGERLVQIKGLQATKKGRMTKDEVRDWLKMLFNITDEASVEIVWEEMEKIRKKKDKGEC